MIETMQVAGASREGVKFTEIPKPVPKQGEIRVRVISSAVNPAEEKVIQGNWVGRFLHAKTSPLVLGWDFSGIVDDIGDGVTDLEKGTAVWGHLAFTWTQRQGAFSEFITISREEIAIKPDPVPHQAAAAAATVTMTGLQSMRDLGRLGAGGSVLLVGAAGGIGSVSVGIAKHLQANVTGVCSTADVDLVHSMGADTVIDRKKQDPFELKSAYDLVFDTPAAYSFVKCCDVLKPGGAYVTTLPGMSLFLDSLQALISSKRCRFVQVASKRKDLELIGSWMSQGLTVPIDSQYDISDLTNALQRQNNPDRTGKVVVNVANGWPA